MSCGASDWGALCEFVELESFINERCKIRVLVPGRAETMVFHHVPLGRRYGSWLHLTDGN